MQIHVKFTELALYIATADYSASSSFCRHCNCIDQTMTAIVLMAVEIGLAGSSSMELNRVAYFFRQQVVTCFSNRVAYIYVFVKAH